MKKGTNWPIPFILGRSNSSIGRSGVVSHGGLHLAAGRLSRLRSLVSSNRFEEVRVETIVLGELRMEGEAEDVSLLHGHGFPLVRGKHRDIRTDPDDAGCTNEDRAKRIRRPGGICEPWDSEEGLEAEDLPPVSIPAHIDVQELPAMSPVLRRCVLPAG